MHGLSEARFRALCEDVYRDRNQIYEFTPAASRAEALLWVLLGSLFSLLSLRDEEIPVVTEPTAQNYVEVISNLVEARKEGAFDPRTILEEFVARVEAADEPSGVCSS